MRPRRLLIALLVGLLVTVLTAWLAMFLPAGNQWYGPPATEDVGLTKASDGYRIFQLSRGRNAWHTVILYWHMQISGHSLMIPTADYEAREVDLDTLPRRLRPESVDDLVMNAWYHEVGWPMPALTCSVHWVTQIRNADIIYRVEGGVQLPRDAEYHPRALPLTPVWPGFVVNVLVWAGAWLIATWLIGTMRASRRARRDRCVHCGYPRTGLAPGARCPECGRESQPAGDGSHASG